MQGEEMLLWLPFCFFFPFFFLSRTTPELTAVSLIQLDWIKLEIENENENENAKKGPLHYTTLRWSGSVIAASDTSGGAIALKREPCEAPTPRECVMLR
jgi:hypothetical protein